MFGNLTFNQMQLRRIKDAKKIVIAMQKFYNAPACVESVLVYDVDEYCTLLKWESQRDNLYDRKIAIMSSDVFQKIIYSSNAIAVDVIWDLTKHKI